jgi:FkbM family methyltransferase
MTMTSLTRKLLASVKKARATPHPLRWFASRAYSQVLYSSGFGRFWVIDRGAYKVHFFKSAMALEMWRDPNYWRAEETEIGRICTGARFVVDVGANIGVTALLAASNVHAEGRIVAIEPHPQVFKWLASNVRLNRYRNITLYNTAVGATEGTARFVVTSSDDSQHHVGDEGTVEVPIRTLDSLLEKHPGTIDVLKIDVEGFEKFVLEGADATLQRTRLVYIEVFEDNFRRFGYSTSSVISMLRARGFSVFDPQGKEVDDAFIARDCVNLVARRE